MRFADKTVLVTGGTSGIGREASIAFAREGARVIFTGRDKARGEAVAAEIAGMAGECLFLQHDVASEESWIDTLAIIKDRFGSLDVLVNNAGIFTHGPIENTSLEDFQAMWETNVNSVFLGMKYAMPLLQAGSGKGAILNVSSLSGLVGHADVVSYCTTKAASIMLTRVMAMEAGPSVRVNAVAPGPVWNELLERAHEGQNAEDMKAYYRESQPLKFLGDSSDVSNGIMFLCSDAARYITGAVFRIDAGRGAD